MRTNYSPESRSDRRFLFYLSVLLIFGFIVLTSAGAPVGYAKFGDPYFFIKRQIVFGFLPGLVLFLFLAKLDYHILSKWSWVLYAGSLLLLAMVFIPGVGVSINNSRSWLTLGGYSFQPSELAKLSIIIVMAGLLADKKKDWDNWQASLLPILAILAPAVFLILAQPDVGTLSIIVVSVFAVLFLAKVPGKYLALLGLLGAVAFVGLIIVAPYRAQRFTTFLHPELDPRGVGYQVNQAFLAIGSGGFWGLGLGHSRQKFQYLPEVSSDSIYAVIGEELGFVISAGLVALILLLGWRGLKIARGAPDETGKLIVGGIVVWFVWQSFLNIGAMVGALPLTGVPLPMVSHGGSALLITLASMGIVMNVSKVSKI